MIAPVLLLAYAVIMGGLGARQLRQASWPQRSPRGGIVAWQALSTSIVVAALLAGMTLALPTLPVDASMTTLLNACFLAIQDQYSTPGGATVASFAALSTLFLAGRLGYALIVEVLTATRRRAGQRRNLLVVAHRDRRTGTLVVPHRDAAVYCLPGRDRLVVCTSSAFAALDAEQLRVVLAHERAHLRWHHHLILTGAGTLRSALPFVPAFESLRQNFSASSRCRQTTMLAHVVAGATSQLLSSCWPEEPPLLPRSARAAAPLSCASVD